MAVAEIIGAVFGVTLLLIVAYMLVGSVLTTAEVVTTAQKDVTLLNEARMRTSINLETITCTGSNPTNCTISVENDGNEIISDFDHMDLFTDANGDTEGVRHLTYSSVCTDIVTTWCISLFDPNNFHPNELDPGEKMSILATVPGNQPIWFQVTTGNGVNAQTTYP